MRKARRMPCSPAERLPYQRPFRARRSSVRRPQVLRVARRLCCRHASRWRKPRTSCARSISPSPPLTPTDQGAGAEPPRGGPDAAARAELTTAEELRTSRVSGPADRLSAAGQRQARRAGGPSPELPLIVMGDLTVIRVRAEVDEQDVPPRSSSARRPSCAATPTRAATSRAR